MEVGERIKKIREKNGLSTNDLSRLTGISQSTISKLENGKRKPELSTLEKIAVALNVFVEKLTGESVSSIIEERLEEKQMTYDELEAKTGVSAKWLKNIDIWIPGIDGFGEASKDFEYSWITKVAEALDLPGSLLRAALARQEVPVYDSHSGRKDIVKSFEEKTLNNFTSTLAAHKLDGYDDDLTEEEQRAVKAFIETYRKQFKKDKE